MNCKNGNNGRLRDTANAVFKTGFWIGMAFTVVLPFVGMFGVPVAIPALTALTVTCGMGFGEVLCRIFNNAQAKQEAKENQRKDDIRLEVLLQDASSLTTDDVEFVSRRSHEEIDRFPLAVRAAAFEAKLRRTIENARVHPLRRAFADKVETSAQELPRLMHEDIGIRADSFSSIQQDIVKLIDYAVFEQNERDRVRQNIYHASAITAVLLS